MGSIVVVVVLGVIAAVLMPRRSHDDEHSVQHYHRQLHTLEEIAGIPATRRRERRQGRRKAADGAKGGTSSRPAPSGSRAPRRCASPGRTSRSVPPVPPPPVPNPSKPLTFDDASPDPVPATFMTGNEDRVIHSINHRPRRLGGPAAAVGAVLVLVLVLILTGLHSNAGKHHGKAATAAHHGHDAPGAPRSITTRRRPRTSTTAPPSVSAPTAATAHTATYTVAAPTYSLNIAATTGECWVDVTNTATGAVLFTTTLQSGPVPHHRRHRAGDGDRRRARRVRAPPSTAPPVTLPPGNQAPFTLTSRRRRRAAARRRLRP